MTARISPVFTHLRLIHTKIRNLDDILDEIGDLGPMKNWHFGRHILVVSLDEQTE